MEDIRKIRDVVRRILREVVELDEYGGKFAEESEIIYRDSNVVAMIPKSQMASRTYGYGTKWCQIGSGFDDWSKQGLLIRFLFKGGRKIRFTYFFDRKRSGMDYYWANENGMHVLRGDGNPFEAQVGKQGTHEITIKTETDILEQMQRIPDACREKVLKFIGDHRKQYDYCYREEEYLSDRASNKWVDAKIINQKYSETR